MARPIKQGLDYFSIDTQMDDKIELLEAKWKLEGFAILIKLFQKIYSHGYYYPWSDREQLLFAGKIHKEIDVVRNFINDCINFEIFDKKMLEKQGVLTSRGIQKRYFGAAFRRKRIEVCQRLILIDINNFINDNSKIVNVDINPINSSCGTQRKGKERKEESSTSLMSTLTLEKNKHYLPLSQSLLDIQLEIDSNFKPRKKSQGSEETVEEWANDFRLLVETDKRPIQTVRDVLTWLQNGSGKDQTFWRRTVSSASGFRRNFPTIYRQYSETANQESKKEEEKRVPFWTCPHCDYKNTQTGSVCFNCKKERWPDEIPDDFKDDITF